MTFRLRTPAHVVATARPLVAAGAALVAVLSWLAWALDAVEGDAVTTALGLTLNAALCALSLRRAQRTPGERNLWLGVGWSAGLLAPCVLLPAVLAGPAGLADPVLAVGVVAAVLAVSMAQHAGLHAWRIDGSPHADSATTPAVTTTPPPELSDGPSSVGSSATVDRHEALMGLAAILITVALLNAGFVLVPAAQLEHVPRWQGWAVLQLPLTLVAVCVVRAQTLLAIAYARGAILDPRMWLLAAASLTTVLIGVDAVSETLQATSLGALPHQSAPSFHLGSLPTSSAGPLLVAPLPLLLLVVAAWLPPRRVAQQAASFENAATLAAFTILVTAVAVLTAAAVGYAAASDLSTLAPTHLAPFVLTSATLSCAAAVLGASRLLLNVRHLAWFTASQREALSDELTGLVNRRGLLRALDEATGSGGSFGLALLDLDRFKEVNDSLGHAAGDELLRQVAARLRTLPSVGPHEDRRVLARLGGDEFVILVTVNTDLLPEPLSGHPRAAAHAWGQRMVALFEAPFELDGARVHVRASAGTTFTLASASTAPASGRPDRRGPRRGRDRSRRRASGEGQVDQHEGAGASEMLRRVDAAMYDAKAATATGAETSSQARSVVYDPALHDGAATRLSLAEDLRTALHQGPGQGTGQGTGQDLGRGRVQVHYQPQLHASDGHLAGVEALVRWQHPVLGAVSPARLVAVAEAYGLMDDLTAHVLDLAVAQAAAWSVAGSTAGSPGGPLVPADDAEERPAPPQWRMSVNLSASSLLDADLPERIGGVLRRHGLPAHLLVVEVTESVLIADLERSTTVLDRLALLGVEVSIDDFGTGYSSLTQLATLPAHEVKLDRAFTQSLHSNARTEAVVDAAITLAHRLGMRVVAEGVEDEATLQHLRAMGCDVTQGWLHAPALPAEQLRAWWSARPERLLDAGGTPRHP